MRKLYHTPEEKREAQRTYDRKRQQTEHRRAYDRKRRPAKSPIVQIPLIPFSRVCLTCGKEKDLSSCFDKQETGKYGYRAHCKECRSKQRQEAPPRYQWVDISSKVCPRCETEKPIDEFAFSKERRDGHSGYCKECQRKWTNSEEEKARQREIYKEERLDPVKAQAQRDRLNAWRREHPESQRELTMRRNARKKAATTEYVDYDAILDRDGMWCYICETPILSDQAIDFDHVIPVSRGGPHCESNVKPTHRLCNRRKADKLLEELSAFDRRGI